ncbi:hypothetical protein [Bifidobacterium catenulatum]|uniref:Uncharacterized protein n=1 Tax=Bifidobacterium catenulatum subsp. kashiwanohense TaxID=630129 RepID=A0AA43P4J5_9BIFI|nr:hypothetical protein [Bifidobacterium catenulatum]MDH7889150.1 hypothetical protein [Bifidobacterium catenulatum subsp. kashiwanohense]
MVGQPARIRGLPFAENLFSFARGAGLDVAFTVESAVNSGTHGSDKNLKEQEPTMNISRKSTEEKADERQTTPHPRNQA